MTIDNQFDEVSEDEYSDEPEAPLGLQSYLVPTAGILASILAVLAWLVLLLGIVQVASELWTDNVLPPAVLVNQVAALWPALVGWGVLMLAAVIARFVAHREDR